MSLRALARVNLAAIAGALAGGQHHLDAARGVLAAFAGAFAVAFAINDVDINERIASDNAAAARRHARVDGCRGEPNRAG